MKRAMKKIRLSSGFDMPIVGLGTWQSKPEEVERAVETALTIGYRHIDTAFNYQNEDAIGRGLKKWFYKGGRREDLFVTSKLPHYGNRPKDVEKFIKLSLERLQLDYLDMYLIHMPFTFIQDSEQYTPAINPDGSYKLDLNTNPVLVWKEMEKQVSNGRAKSIGLSNFNESQLKEVWDSAEIKPSNLQVELHAFHQQKSLREVCRRYNIAVTSYSSLASPGVKTNPSMVYKFDLSKFPDLLGHPVVEKIANAHHKSPAQVLLRHLVDHGIIVIPKSVDPQRMEKNFQLFDFELTDDDGSQLDALDRGTEGRIFDALFFKGVEKHPYYPFKDALVR